MPLLIITVSIFISYYEKSSFIKYNFIENQSEHTYYIFYLFKSIVKYNNISIFHLSKSCDDIPKYMSNNEL